jgi:3-oxoacyl-[acyl-carrier protein] reductase
LHAFPGSAHVEDLDDVEGMSKLPPLERLGQPQDIANVVSFLAGPEGGWVNGQVLRANGGFA